MQHFLTKSLNQLLGPKSPPTMTTTGVTLSHFEDLSGKFFLVFMDITRVNIKNSQKL